MAKFGEKSKKEVLESNANLPVPVKEIDYEKDIADDYEYARKMYKDLLDTGMGTLENLASLAGESESPRAFEVLSTSIKNLSDVTDKLMALQKNVKEVKKKETGDGQTPKGLTQNNMFIGSTKELAKLFETQQEKVIGQASDE